MIAINSSNIRAVEYDEQQQILKVQFTNQATYQYSGVPAATYRDFMAANSKGAFFASEIKSVYPYEKLS